MTALQTCNNALRYKERTIDSLIFTITCNFSSPLSISRNFDRAIAWQRFVPFVRSSLSLFISL